MATTTPPRGVFCAALTPVHADLTPNHQAFAAHCRKLMNDGLTGIALLGTTGEANSFSGAERRALLETALQAGIAPEMLMPGTGVTALTETVDLTRHALSVSVNTVVMLPPFYYKNISDDGLFAAYAEVVERVGDSKLAIVLYHIPQFSAVPIPFAVIERLRTRYPGTFVGVKDSAGDLNHMVELVERFPGLSVLAGADPLMLPLLHKGGAGAITATTNIIGADLAFVCKHYNDDSRQEEVQAAQARVVAARNRASVFAQMASLKALVAQQTGDTSWHNMRPPLVKLTDEEREKLLADR